MTTPVTYVELNSPVLEATTSFMRDVFGWEPQPFAAPDYHAPRSRQGCYLTDPAGLPDRPPRIRLLCVAYHAL